MYVLKCAYYIIYYIHVYIMLCIWSWAFISCYYNRGDAGTVFGKCYQVLTIFLCVLEWAIHWGCRITTCFSQSHVLLLVFMVYFTLIITALKVKQKKKKPH